MKNLILVLALTTLIWGCADNSTNSNNIGNALTIEPNLTINVTNYKYIDSIQSWEKNTNEIWKYNTNTNQRESFYYKCYSSNWGSENFDKKMGTKIMVEQYYMGKLYNRETNIFDSGKYFINRKRERFDTNGSMISTKYTIPNKNDNGKLIKNGYSVCIYNSDGFISRVNYCDSVGNFLNYDLYNRISNNDIISIITMSVSSKGDYKYTSNEFENIGFLLKKETNEQFYYGGNNPISWTSYEYNDLGLVKKSISSGNSWVVPESSSVDYQYDKRGFITTIIYSNDNKPYKKSEFTYQ